MLSLLIAKIITFFLIMMAGFAIVKFKLLQGKEISALSRITLYLIIPCVILRSFETQWNETIRRGILFSLGVAIGVHLFFFALVPLLRKKLRLNEVETLSVIYPNAGNLTLPLVAATLGWDHVIYASSYIMVQQFLIWSHGRMMMQGEPSCDWKKMFLNVNIIVTFIGIGIFLTQTRFPAPLRDAVHSVADMVGPATMLISGILLASTKVSAISGYRKWWIVVLLRLILLPLILVLVFKYSGLAGIVADGTNILLVTLFAVVTPPATTLTLMAEVYRKDAVYANLLNVISTLLFLVTMPLLLAFYLA